MRMFTCGDIHGYKDYKKLIRFKELHEDFLTKDDYLVVCGDLGYFVENSSFYDTFPCKILWVDGNHEDYDSLMKLPVEEWCGGLIGKASENVFHLKRGEVYEINGFKFLAFGGAKSIDRGYDTGDNDFWWKEELSSEDEFENMKTNLAKHNNVVDYVFTHDCGYNRAFLLNGLLMDKSLRDERFDEMLDYIADNVGYKKWYCGHYHIDAKTESNGVVCLFNSIEEVDVNGHKFSFKDEDDFFEKYRAMIEKSKNVVGRDKVNLGKTVFIIHLGENFNEYVEDKERYFDIGDAVRSLLDDDELCSFPVELKVYSYKSLSLIGLEQEKQREYRRINSLRETVESELQELSEEYSIRDFSHINLYNAFYPRQGSIFEFQARKYNE